MPTTARYDKQAQWYEEFAGPGAETHRAAIHRLLGPGSGWCLDLGCGTGHYSSILRDTGRGVVGVDLSRNQLRYASKRNPHVVQASADRLPFADDTFAAVTTLWISTDVDDFAPVVREAARLMRSGGRFLFYGAHPCFNGPCVENRDDGARIVHPAYRLAGWHAESPWWGENGIRRRVGVRHVPLGELFQAILGAGLRIVDVQEPGSDEIPSVLGIIATS
ncbi:MAG TPA: methyltransferase domain-containing protein [Mycobacteriales bacterium]|nr:methyltransferase domain-containing protein [Mycobacteriales bacterium]